MGVIDEVKQRTEIVDVIGQYTKLIKAGRTFRALCPFHSEKDPSFFVYPERQSWHCFGACSTGGDVFSFLMKKENIDFGEALRLLAQRAGVAVPSKLEKDPERERKARLFELSEAAAQYYHNLLLSSPAAASARDYLVKRGISEKAISDFRLGFSLSGWETLKQHLAERRYTEAEMIDAGLVIASDDTRTHDRFRNRLMFPIRDERGHVTGFGARVLDDSLPKYTNSPQTLLFDKSGTLYGIDLAAPAIRQQNMAVIVEGYMDVIAAHQHGFSNVVASMGTAITEKQVNILKRMTRNLVLALDADAAGEEAMLRCVSYENTLDSEVRIIVLPENKDPDEVMKEAPDAWRRLVETAIPVIDFTFNIAGSKLDLTTARDRSSAVRQLGPIIAEIKDVVRQTHYLQKLARLVRVNELNLQDEIRRIRSSQHRRRTSAVAETGVSKSANTSTWEESCLALLLQHPELRTLNEDLLPEYFQNSENREIFVAWREADDVTDLRDRIDATLREHFDALASRSILPGQIEQKYAGCVLRLKERFLRHEEEKKADALALEAEMGGTVAELAKLNEMGIKGIEKLGEVFAQKAKTERKHRR